MNDLNQAHLKTDHAASLAAVAERIDTILLGKPQAVRLSLACLIARGHLRTDPVLPERLLPDDWPGAALRNSYMTFAAELTARRKTELMEAT